MKKKYKPIDCPVCDEFYFSPLTEEDIEDGDNGLRRVCHVCGWKYDLDQIENPECNGINRAPIAKLKEIFVAKRTENIQYNYLESSAPKTTPHLCPVCGKYMFDDADDHDICPNCGWENDLYGEWYPDSDGGANHTSLNQMRKEFLSKK